MLANVWWKVPPHLWQFGFGAQARTAKHTIDLEQNFILSTLQKKALSLICASPFSWDDSENNLQDRGIHTIANTPLLEPFAEENSDTTNLLMCAQKLISILDFKKPVVDVIGLIRSFLFKAPITSYGKPSELFQSTCYSKSFLQILSAFPMFCMNRWVFTNYQCLIILKRCSYQSMQKLVIRFV